MDLAAATAHCGGGLSLPPPAVPSLVDQLLDPSIAPGPKADFLRSLSDKGETAGEVAAFVRALLPHAVHPPFAEKWGGAHLFDCCGTGGGGLNIFNVSTAAMFVLSACGVPVIKHGNRGVTKNSGSADVLQALGIDYGDKPGDLQRSLEEVGMAFVFAPAFHPAFKHVAPVRQQLAAEGRRSIFNLLGPLLNPARPNAQMVGVFKKEHLELFSDVLGLLGRKRYVALYGSAMDGRPLGEASASGVTELRGFLDGESVGIEYELAVEGGMDALLVDSATESAAFIELVLEGKGPGLAQAMLVENAGLGLWVQGGASSLGAGRELATGALAGGEAYRKLLAWRELARSGK